MFAHVWLPAGRWLPRCSGDPAPPTAAPRGAPPLSRRLTAPPASTHPPRAQDVGAEGLQALAKAWPWVLALEPAKHGWVPGRGVAVVDTESMPQLALLLPMQVVVCVLLWAPTLSCHAPPLPPASAHRRAQLEALHVLGLDRARRAQLLLSFPGLLQVDVEAALLPLFEYLEVRGQGGSRKGCCTGALVCWRGAARRSSGCWTKGGSTLPHWAVPSRYAPRSCHAPRSLWA